MPIHSTSCHIPLSLPPPSVPLFLSLSLSLSSSRNPNSFPHLAVNKEREDAEEVSLVLRMGIIMTYVCPSSSSPSLPRSVRDFCCSLISGDVFILKRKKKWRSSLPRFIKLLIWAINLISSKHRILIMLLYIINSGYLFIGTKFSNLGFFF